MRVKVTGGIGAEAPPARPNPAIEPGQVQRLSFQTRLFFGGHRDAAKWPVITIQ
jgi:hypothetical protein